MRSSAGWKSPKGPAGIADKKGPFPAELCSGLLRTLGPVSESCVLQGRRIEPAEFLQLRELVARHPDWSRYRLSRELCVLWNWRTATGQWKDMAARTLMLKLAQRGWIELPAPRRRSPNRYRLAPPPARRWPATPIHGPLADLGPLTITEVSRQAEGRAEVRAALARFHYLGDRTPVGENLQYVVRDGTDRLLAVLVFGSTAWKCVARDRWIGWTPLQRQSRLRGIANNQRFPILPGVEVRHLASHVLGRVARRMAKDWQAKYGHRVVLLETFVERDRFSGTCYRAANWQALGSTQGQSRQDRQRTLQVPVKDLYLYPLRADARKALIR